MKIHPLLGKVQDPIIRQILEDYRIMVSEEIQTTITQTPFTISVSGEGSSGGIQPGDQVMLIPRVSVVNPIVLGPLNPRGGG